MKTLHRNKRKIYVCNVFSNGNIRNYSEPIPLMENWRVSNEYSDMANYGYDSYGYVRIRTSINHAKYYHLGDKVFIFNTPPDEYDVLCKDADYEVYIEPIVSINECDIHLKRISGKNEHKNIF